MTVAHIFWGLGYGGIETMLVNIANAQVKLGAEVHIIVINKLMEQSLVDNLDKRVHFHCLGRPLKTKNLWFIVKLNMMLRKIAPDVIHLHGSQFYTIIFGRKQRSRVCATLHDLPSGKVRRAMSIARLFPILNFHIPGNVCCIDLVPKVFAISMSVQKELLDRYGVKSIVVKNGILTEKFQQRGNELLADGRPMRIVCVSRLEHEKKGQDLLIEVVTKMKGKVDVTLIGDGSSREYLENFANQTEWGGYIHFLGKKPQEYIEGHLKDYDVFVQASRYEGFGLTVVEAMAAKLPVLVSSGQGPAEVTEDEHYGWVFDNGNIDDLASKLEYIRTHYEEALVKTKKAYGHVIKRYDVSVTAKAYLDNYLRT